MKERAAPDQFPLPIWQDGSGRDTDANVIEVLANQACQFLGGAVGRREPINPTRDVNSAQSLGGTFAAAMHVATVIEIETALAPRCLALAKTIERNSRQSSDHGRRLRTALGRLDEAEGSLHETGADLGDKGMTVEDWQVVVALISAHTARPFILAPGGFSDRGSVDAMVAAMAAGRGLAIVLLDIAEEVYRCGYPQAEVMAMVCRHVIGQDQVVAFAATRKSVAGSAARPVIIASVLNALNSLREGCDAMRPIAGRMGQNRQEPPSPQR